MRSLRGMVSQAEFQFDQLQLHEGEVPVIVTDQIHGAVDWCGLTRGEHSLGGFHLLRQKTKARRGDSPLSSVLVVTANYSGKSSLST
jgi:hypothetical protein